MSAQQRAGHRTPERVADFLIGGKKSIALDYIPAFFDYSQQLRSVVTHAQGVKLPDFPMVPDVVQDLLLDFSVKQDHGG
jgi:hypothetical protein